MALLITGIIEITGEHGTGKTTAALECGAKPEEIIFYDDDIKGVDTVDNFEKQSGRKIKRIDAKAMRTSCKRLYDYYPIIKSSIDAIAPKQYSVAIFDTWTEIQRACRSYVEKYPEKFCDPILRNGKTAYFSGDSTMVNGQISRLGRELEAEIVNSLIKKVDAIFLIAHLKKDYLNNVETGKMIPDDGKLLETIASMRVWYRSNPYSSVPISLFLKRPSVKGWSDELDRITTINPFPRKITPAPEDTSVWDAYIRYLKNHIGNRNPTPEETPSNYELSIIENTLTP